MTQPAAGHRRVKGPFTLHKSTHTKTHRAAMLFVNVLSVFVFILCLYGGFAPLCFRLASTCGSFAPLSEHFVTVCGCCVSLLDTVCLCLIPWDSGSPPMGAE